MKRFLTQESIGLLLGLLIVAGMTRLPSVVLGLFGIWLLVRHREVFRTESSRRWGMIFLLLWLPVLFSWPTSVARHATMELAVMLPFFYLVGIALVHVLRAHSDRGRLTRGIAVIMIVWTVDGLIQYFFGKDLLGIPISNDGRVVGMFSGNLHLGLFLVVLLPILLWPLTTRKPLLALVLLLLVGIVVGLSGARTNLFFLILVVLGLMLKLPWRYSLAAMLAFAVVVATSNALSPVQHSRLAQFGAMAPEKAASNGVFERIDGLLSGRLTIWETGGRMLMDRPLTGVGARAFAEAYDRYATRPDDPFRKGGSYDGGVYHAHQMYVSIAAETGFPGLLALIAAVLLCIRWYWRADAVHQQAAAPYAWSLLVVAFPINSQPVLYTLWWFPIMLLLLCAMLAALGGKMVTNPN